MPKYSNQHAAFALWAVIRDSLDDTKHKPISRGSSKKPNGEPVALFEWWNEQFQLHDGDIVYHWVAADEETAQGRWMRDKLAVLMGKAMRDNGPGCVIPHNVKT